MQIPGYIGLNFFFNAFVSSCFSSDISSGVMLSIVLFSCLNFISQKLISLSALFVTDKIETNIYDFSRFLLQFTLDRDVEIHNIFVYGDEKSNFYVGPNPKIPNSANFFHFGTEQGLQYINREDIYYRSFDTLKIYRYWKCYGINALSYQDERFSHFSENDRIW